MTTPTPAAEPSLVKPRDQMYTVLVVDPIAVPLSRWLATKRWVTPNRVSAVALLIGVAAAVLFAVGELRWGGGLFLLRFGVDCLDGKVARAQGTSSARGAALDQMADLVGILLAAGGLSAAAVAAGGAPSWLGLVLLGSIGLYAWALQYRKQLAAVHGLGTGGAEGRLPRAIPGLGAWQRFADRKNMSPIPWAVEAEVLTLGFLPLLAPGLAVWSMAGLASFYLLASGVNLRRISRLAHMVDSAERPEVDTSPSPNQDPTENTPHEQTSADSAPTPATNDLPLVSVVIATHNRPELLRVAVKSALDQDYAGPIEVVVVFDQSEPDLSLIQDDASRSVRVTANTERKPGLAGARNTGILAARGELVAFCDDDDEWLPEKIRLQVDELRRLNVNTAVTGITILYSDRSVDRVPQPGDVTLEQFAQRRVMEAHPSSVVVRRDALLGPIGLVDEDIPGSYGEDYDWILRAAQVGDIAVVSKPLVRVRWGQSLFSTRWATIVESIDYGIAKHPVLSSDPRGLARLYGRRAFALAALGRRRESFGSAWRAFKLNWRERRVYVATAVALGLVSAQRVQDAAHKRGHGI